MKTKIFSFILLFTILSLTLFGFCDLLLYSKRYIQFNYSQQYKKQFIKLLPEGVDPTKFAAAFDDSQDLKYIKKPFIGNILVPGDYGIYSIDHKGKRVISKDRSVLPRPKNLLLLGSSQAFGYLNSDQDSLAYELSQRLPDYEIDNYATPGQSTLETLARWQNISNSQKKDYQLAIILNGPYDYLSECRYAARVPARGDSELNNYIKPAVYTIFHSLIKKFIHSEKPFKNNCTDPEQQQFVAKQIVRHLQRIIKYGESLNIKTLIFIPPSLWGNSANLKNLRPGLDQKEKLIFDNIENYLSKEASYNNKIIDLSHMFDNDEHEFFLDLGAHFTAEGNEIISQEIAIHLK